MNIVKWAVCRPDMNPIENGWGQIVRIIYRDGHQYQDTNDLKKAIFLDWNYQLSLEQLKNQAMSMPSRVF